MINQELIQYINGKSFRGYTELDTDLYRRINKGGIDSIVMGNFVRSALDHVRDCSTIIYPDLSCIDPDSWSIGPNKLKFEVETFIFSRKEMEEMIENIIEILRGGADG